MEHLKQIEDYPDYYVSDQGNVYSNKLGSMKRLKSVESTNGYLGVVLYNKGNTKRIGVHRLVAQAFIPNPNDKSCVNHIDGNKQNNCADNLEWVTHKENSQYFQNVQKANGNYDKSSKIKDWHKCWCDKHQEELKEYTKRWRDEHREEINARAKKYREKQKSQQKSHN